MHEICVDTLPIKTQVSDYAPIPSNASGHNDFTGPPEELSQDRLKSKDKIQS